MKSPRSLALIKSIIALGALVTIVAAYRAWLHVNPTTVALTLVLFILLLAARMGLRYAVAISVLATLCYNFYFLPPIGTLTISDPENWLALFAFLATGVIGSRLSQQARDEAEHARSRQREVELLLALSRELLQTDKVAQIVSLLPSILLRVSGSSSVTLFMLEGDLLYRAGVPRPMREDLTHMRQLALAIPDVEALPDATVRIPMREGVRPRGLLILSDLHMSDESYRTIGGLASIAIDRAQALEAVARSEANKESERLRTLMLDSITHELRTPLTAIKGAASTLLANDLMSPEARVDLLSIVDEEADRLNRLIGQAVEMAQIEAREVHMTVAPTSFERLLEKTRSSCAGVFAPHREITIQAPRSLRVEADEEMIVKVLCNLLENASKYSPVDALISITAEQRGGTALISVADRGVGIDPAEQELIFDRLYRGRTRTPGIPGTGMGLAISRAIVEAHNGTLTVTSQPGRGSVFTFTLPCKAS